MNKIRTRKKDNGFSLVLFAVCFYIFLVIERPWESISYLEGLPIERSFAILMILIAALSGRFKIVSSPTNKWVFGFLLLHFALVPFSFDSGFTVDQGVEYAKMTILYILMLSVADDERALKILVWAFVLSTFLYMLHSLWEFNNGRHVYRMGIARMIGVDSFMFDPNSFGATLVLCLPFSYALYMTNRLGKYKVFFISYLLISVLCIVLTGSRSAVVGLVSALIIFILIQKPHKSLFYFILSFLCVLLIWTYIPDDKKDRIRTLWDKDAGPSSAHESADGRVAGFVAGLEMLKRYPLTGVGPGRNNFAMYRSQNLDGKLEQSHNLVGQILGGMGLGGGVLLVGLTICVLRINARSIKYLKKANKESLFVYYLCGANIVSLVLLLIFGIAGHNFYRPLWLWIAAWSGAVFMIISKKYVVKTNS